MPTMNNAMLTFVPDDKVDSIMEQLRAMDEETPDLGLRAFVWNVICCVWTCNHKPELNDYKERDKKMTLNEFKDALSKGHSYQ